MKQILILALGAYFGLYFWQTLVPAILHLWRRMRA